MQRQPGYRVVPVQAGADDPLLAFARETSAPTPSDQRPDASASASPWLPLTVAAAVIVCAAAGGYWVYPRAQAAPPATGWLRLTSEPPGATVLIDGTASGMTPLRLSLATGKHHVEIRTAAASRSLDVVISSQAESSQHFELAPPKPSSTGALEVSTDPPGASVAVDGLRRGMTPLRVSGLSTGTHHVVVSRGEQSIARDITVQSAGTAVLVVPMVVPNRLMAGWVRISSPEVMQIFEEGRLLGTTETDRLMLPVGDHRIEIVNEGLGYHREEILHVVAGRTTALELTLPRGTLHVNAPPRTDVWIDGQARGEAPLENVSLPIGSHEVLFRHPQLGDARRIVLITVSGSTRVGVDFQESGDQESSEAARQAK